MKIMDFDVLCEYVVKAHDRTLLKGQIPGLAPDKSLESVLQRPYNRLQYGMVDDVFHLAACFAVSIIRGHAFNDANKRTGLAVMALILKINNIQIEHDQIELADMMVAVADNRVDEDGLAKWLRDGYVRFIE